MQFLVTMLDIIHPEECKWNYDYKEKGLKQDDVEWEKLCLQTLNQLFDINNLWKLYSDKQGADSKKPKSKDVMKEVNFSDRFINPWVENVNVNKYRGFQTIKASGRGMILSLNRLPIYIKKKRIDVVDVLQTFFLKNLVSDEGISHSEYVKKTVYY